MKIIGKRRENGPSSLEEAQIFQKTVNDLRGGGLVRKGVYRFSSFDEAETWMIQEMINSRIPLKPKI